MDLVIVRQAGKWVIQEPPPPDSTATAPVVHINPSLDPGDKLHVSFTCFENLTVELRLTILEAALIDDKPIVDLKPLGVNLAVLRVSKWFHEQGLKIYYAKNVFHFTNILILLNRIEVDSLKVPRPNVSLQRSIRHLSLDVLLAESFELTETPTQQQLQSMALKGYFPIIHPSNLTINPAVTNGDLTDNPIKMVRINASWSQQVTPQLVQHLKGNESLVHSPIHSIRINLKGAACLFALPDFLCPRPAGRTLQYGLGFMIAALTSIVVHLQRVHVSGLEDQVTQEKLKWWMMRHLALQEEKATETGSDDKSDNEYVQAA